VEVKVRLGEGVQVRNRFEGDWVQGFEVAEVEEDGDGTRFRLRRSSDGVVLPALFSAADLRVGDRHPRRLLP
jgi:hypothetical protein